MGIFIIFILLFIFGLLFTNSFSDDKKLLQSKYEINGKTIEPGNKDTFLLNMDDNNSGESFDIPITVLHGEKKGPVVCLTGGIHGDELNGVEIVRRLTNSLQVEKVHGTIISVPIVNLLGFRRGNRYLPDRRDLNRYFPGHPDRSLASRIAHTLFSKIIVKCNYLIDFHTASFHRTNLTQIRADLSNELIKNMALHFKTNAVIHNIAAKGTLRRAAVDKGIPTIICESGLPLHFQQDKINESIKGMYNLFKFLKVLEGDAIKNNENEIFNRSKWIRSNRSGIMINKSKLGNFVKEGDTLAVVIDPIDNSETIIKSNYNGQIIGMSVSQIVMPGYAVFHIAQKKEDAKLKPIEGKEVIDDQEGRPD